MSAQTITAPDDADIERIARQVLRVDQLAHQHLGRGLAEDESDLELLQELLDKQVIARDATYDLQCLGVVLGTCLADAVEGMDWAIVEDEHGRDPALRYRETTLLVFPLTMLSKRVEDGVEVDVRHIFDQLCDGLEDLKAQADADAPN